eukprot:9015402-Karenia_brevis.AAC.1
MLKSSGFGVLAEDKGPNFVLVTPENCRKAYQSVLDGPEYKEDVVENLNFRAIAIVYADFAKRISTFTGKSSDFDM